MYPRHPSISSLASALLLAALGAGTPAALGESLTLRVNDVMGRPGGMIAVVLRTYAPRTIGQGQICLRMTTPAEGLGADPSQGAPAKGVAQPLAGLDSFLVFSENGDAVTGGSFEGEAQTALIFFASPSGTINQSDGPMAVLFFRLSDSLVPGTSFDVTIDPAETMLFEPGGQEVALELRSGELEIRSPGAPVVLAADGAEAPPGGIARLGVATSELFPIAAGEVGFRFDPELAGGAATVFMDPRHGQAAFTVDDSEPGLLAISFSSPDASLNSIPGNLISIDLPISPQLPIGTESTIWLDPELTSLTGPGGSPIPLVLEDDVVELVPPLLLFGDGFESGDLAGWSAASP